MHKIVILAGKISMLYIAYYFWEKYHRRKKGKNDLIAAIIVWTFNKSINTKHKQKHFLTLKGFIKIYHNLVII